jgi:hypothetical protein
MKIIVYLRRALASLQSFVGGPEAYSRVMMSAIHVIASTCQTKRQNEMNSCAMACCGVHGHTLLNRTSGVNPTAMLRPHSVTHPTNFASFSMRAILTDRSSKRNRPLVLCLTGGNG